MLFCGKEAEQLADQESESASLSAANMTDAGDLGMGRRLPGLRKMTSSWVTVFDHFRPGDEHIGGVL
jgi:hypothetical protein